MFILLFVLLFAFAEIPDPHMFVSTLSSLKFTRALAYALWKSSPRVGSYFVGGVYGSGDRIGVKIISGFLAGLP